MPANITIKKATPADVPLIYQFIKELAEFEKRLHEVVATEELLHQTLFGGHQHAETVIAYLGDIPVGFALYFYTYSTFLGRPGIYLEDVYVQPAYRNQGFGMTLLAYLARVAKDEGCHRLEWSVLTWNKDAIRFYERLGAVVQDEWHKYRLTGKKLEELSECYV